MIVYKKSSFQTDNHFIIFGINQRKLFLFPLQSYISVLRCESSICDASLCCNAQTLQMQYVWNRLYTYIKWSELCFFLY